MPYGDILNPLMQRLVELLGVPAAIERVRGIPGLVVDADGVVLHYDPLNPQQVATQLLALYEDAAREQRADATSAAAPPSAGPARIIIVDDHALVREGLATLMHRQADMQVVGHAGSMREAITQAKRLRPDLILMDFTLPDGTGDEATRLILADLPATKIVFLTVHDDDERLMAAITAGATGYLLKSIRSAELIERLRAVLEGDVALSPTLGRRLFDQISRQRSLPAPQAPSPGPAPLPPPIDDLTERETEILRLIVRGYTNRQIADDLKLSVRTVEYHRSNLLHKLGLSNRADLVRFAAEHGLFGAAAPPDHDDKR